MENMIALSNVMSNAHFFALKFALAVIKESGEIINVSDDFGDMLCMITWAKFENLGIEFNREKVLQEIFELGEGYAKYPAFRHAFDELYKAMMLGDEYKPTNNTIS